MTAPSSPQPDPTLIAQHETAARVLEDAAIAAAVSAPVAALAALNAWIAAEWLRLFGAATRTARSGWEFQLYAKRVASRLRSISLPNPSVILSQVRRARTLGITQGLEEAGHWSAHSAAVLDGDLPASLRDAVADAVTRAERAVRVAQQMATALTEGTLTDVQTAVQPAVHAVNGLKRDTVTIVHTALNDGIQAAVRAVDGIPLWIAERDACTVCLALAGQFADENGVFDVTATFGATPYPVKRRNRVGEIETVDLVGPPRHPNCRCRITPWMGERTIGPHDFPTLLRREAERSVFNGYARPGESVATRARAAERLLSSIGTSSRAPSGWVAPASVRTRTRRALREGAFTTRRVPRG